MTGTTMRALVLGRGPDWALVERPVPEPGPGEVLVRNRAAAVNHGDFPMLAAADPTAGGHGEESIAGFEYAGEIVAVGPDVRGRTVGDLVFGIFPASFAEYVTVDARYLLRRSAALAPEIACALPSALLTEYGALAAAGFAAGQSVLITGASSGIGLVGVQTARALGASKIIATTRSASRRGLLTELGADTVVVTGEQDLTETVLAATDGVGVDVSLDHVGGATFAACLPATAVDGQVVNIGRLDGPASTVDLDALSYRHLTVRGVSFGFSRPWEVVPLLEQVSEIVMPAVDDGRIRPIVDSTVDVAEAAQAAERMRSGAAVGKLVFRF
ncbi:MAG: zinc-binding dehydrogenase [Gordonia sp. (in: high G+C Gram-positive bacteria)]|uniref:quinone oxidoreductase family protein n=1 Tax=Gordonia sp. (in: high G+C Gram-positive bacteria) TaxID=84139 RepID=UPI0039E28279